MLNKALFLDRDGIVNIDYGYVYKIENFQFQNGIFDVCRFFQDKKYKIIIITNQSGITRGYFTEDDLKKLNIYMLSEFKKEGINITDVLYCIFSDDAHPDRKPNPGLFIKAANKYALNMAVSLSIGDNERDIIAAQSAGVGTNVLLVENKKMKSNAEHIITNLQEIVNLCM